MHLADKPVKDSAIDKDWIDLMAAAKKLGISIAEIKDFLARGEIEIINNQIKFYMPPNH